MNRGSATRASAGTRHRLGTGSWDGAWRGNRRTARRWFIAYRRHNRGRTSRAYSATRRGMDAIGERGGVTSLARLVGRGPCGLVNTCLIAMRNTVACDRARDSARISTSGTEHTADGHTLRAMWFQPSWLRPDMASVCFCRRYAHGRHRTGWMARLMTHVADGACCWTVTGRERLTMIFLVSA